VTHTEGNELRKLGETANVDELLYILRAFLDADAAMRESPHPRVELEMATVRATRRPVPKALEEILERVEEAAKRLGQGGDASAPAPARTQDTLPAREEPVRPAAPTPRVAAPPVERPAAVVPDRKPKPPAEPQPAGTVERAPAPVERAPAPSVDTSPVWQRVVDDVMRRKPTLGAVLAQSKPGGLRDGELTIVLSGNHFHREMLADSANREVVLQALRKHVPGAERFRVSAEDDGGGGVATHPTVQAAVAEFQGEVVAVRPRSPEGEGQ
jgi:hypothetical protein